MQFKPAGGTFISDIEKGIFTGYEIKSCIDDVYSGNGLNFIGEENYIVTTMQTYKKLLLDINSGKLSAPYLGVCPECGDKVLHGKYGAYCNGKCGIMLNMAFGKALTDVQIKNILDGKKRC